MWCDVKILVGELYMHYVMYTGYPETINRRLGLGIGSICRVDD